MSSYPAFGTQTNPQQQPQFQAQQSSMYQAAQTPTWGQRQDEEEDPAGPAGPAAPAPTQTPTATPKAPATPGAAQGAIPSPAPTSPVSATGKLSSGPATPWGQPQAAPEQFQKTLDIKPRSAYQSVFQQPLRAPAPAGAPHQYQTAQAGNASEQVLGLYQQNFGRSASPAEVQHWINQVGGGAQLTPQQLQQIQTQFQQAPEFKSYTGPRPTLQPGQFIPGVTLGSTLQADPNGVFRPQAPTEFAPGQATPRPAESVYQGYDFGQFLQAQMAPAYGGSQFTQFASPQQQQLEGMGNQLVQQILSRPDAVSGEQITQLKAQQQELVNSRTKENQAALEGNLAARGLSGSGGAAAAGQRRLQSGATNALAAGQRDIDLRAAELNNQSRQQASTTASNYLSSQMGRATQGYGATLAGEGARADDARAVAQSGQQNAQFDLASKGFTFNQQQARAQDQQARANSVNQAYGFDQTQGLGRDQLALQAYMGQRGLDLDGTKVSNQATQFNQGLGLDFMRFLEDKFRGRADIDLRGRQLAQQGTQFNSQLAFNYDNLAQDKDMTLLQWLQRQQQG